MINPSISDGILFITSNNWKQTTEKLYGYKTCKNNGNWIETIWKNDSELEITSSFTSIPIALYNDGDYWVISNSISCLVNHLKSIGKTLTVNDKSYLLTTPMQNNPYHIHAYNATETFYHEIEVLPLNTTIYIHDGKLDLITKQINYFSVPVEDSCEILLDWIEDWRNYFSSIKDEDVFKSMSLSGGLDSRIIFLMLKNYVKLDHIVSYWTKNSNTLDCKNNYYDGLIARCLAYDTNNINLIYTAPYDRREKSVHFNTYLVFDWGNLIPSKQYLNENTVINGNSIKRISIRGTGSECLKDSTASNLHFLQTNVKRNFCTTNYQGYYFENTITVSPFLDERLHMIKADNTKTLMFLFYILLDQEDYLFKFPFISKEEPYFITKDDKDYLRAKSIVDNYYKNKR